MRRHKITAITPESIGESLEIEAGDFLLEIDGQAIGDVFDYRMAVQSEVLTVLVEKGADGELWELDIEKDEDEDLGLIFETPLMDAVRTCQNKCIFCFVEQQPPGLRDSLYVKDDDVRMSFLHGNYVTLTNVTEGEIKRITRYHLSPLRISVHTTDGALRCRMMGNKKAGRLLSVLERFNQAGIEMHFQAVICKGFNDGEKLDETIKGLLALRPGAASLAVVPAGLTRHRAGLAPLEGFTAADANAVITQVENRQKKCRQQYGTAFVFAADEWYVLAGRAVPDFEAYEDFPQLDNGVGVMALFARGGLQSLGGYQSVGLVTGTAAYGFMCGLARAYEKKHPAVRVQVFEVVNDFFGHSVTVSGLLTGGDVIAQMQGKCGGLEVLFLPENAFRAETEVMLDGTTRGELEAALGVAVRIGRV